MAEAPTRLQVAARPQAPSRYRPMRHPGRPGRWEREAILEALGAWVAETGGPPRRRDWSGELAEQASPGQRKWMGEHPRWPSSSCVASHFGSWSAALEAAGLPARRLTFEQPAAERVATARRLSSAGQTVRQIAEALGVSLSSVRNYLSAGSCLQCGGPVPSPNATRCIACTAPEPTVRREWDRESVRVAVRDWMEEHGAPPSYRAWTPSRAQPGEWEASSPRWPSAAIVCDLYGEHEDPWNAALADAGAEARLRRWSDEAIRAALAAFWTRTGHPPTPEDLRARHWHGPSQRTLRRRFGSVERAWRALGPVPA